MSRYRKRKKPRMVDEVEFSEVNGASSGDVFIGFPSTSLLPAQRYDEPPLVFTVEREIKQEADDDDSTETVVRGENSSCQSIHPQNFLPTFPIKTEPPEGDSRNTREKVQCFDEISRKFFLKRKIKEESDEESDDSTETVIRGETNNIESIHQIIHPQNSRPIFPIITEPEEHNSRKSQEKFCGSSHHRDVTSPKNVTKFRTNSVDDTQSSPLQSPSLKSSLYDPNRKFSWDNEKFLLLNADFDLKDIRECIEYITTTYLSNEKITASSNCSQNASCVPISDFEKEKDVSQISFCDIKVTELPKSPERMSGTSETNGTGMKTLFGDNKHLSLEKNQAQRPKSLSFFENSNRLKGTSKFISDTKMRDKNGLSYEPIQVNSSKSYGETSNQCIDKESSSTSLSAEKLNEIIKNAESHFSHPSHESLAVTIDNHLVAPLQVKTVSSKRHASEEIGVQKVQENNAFVSSKRFKHSSILKNISRKEDSPLHKPTHSAISGEHKNLNHPISNDCKEPPVKRVKIAYFQNKHQIQQRNIEAIDEKSVRSPLATCYSSSVTTSDRLHPHALPVLEHTHRSQTLAEDMYSQSDAVTKDPRLHRTVSSIAPCVASPASQTVVTGKIPPVPSSSKELRKKRSSSLVTDLSPKVHNNREEKLRKQKGHRLDSSGKKAIPPQDVSFRIIAWKAWWLLQKNNEILPPICNEIKRAVQDSYETFHEYYETYYGLHLISIWFEVLRSWKEKPPSFCAEFDSCEERTYYYKNRCSAKMLSVDMPVNQSIIHIICKAENDDKQLLLGFVCHVEQRPIVDGDLSWRHVRFHFYTVERLKARKKSRVHIRKLPRLRVAIKQLSSLKSLRASPVKEILLNPRNHVREIKIVKIPSTGTELKDLVDKIVKTATSPKNRFTLVEQPPNADTRTIVSLIRKFVPKHSTLLVCLRDTDRCFQIAKVLSYGFVLALNESEILNFPDKFKGFTLRSEVSKKYKDPTFPVNLKAAELDVLEHAKIILTVTSQIFLGDNENATLGRKLTVIIEHSTMCTELETALPLSYGPENVVLLGCPKDFLSLNAHLHLRDYQKSLFHRLHEAKTISKKKRLNYFTGR